MPHQQQQALWRFKASLFQALAHPTRLAILTLLRQGEKPANAIIEHVGVEQANASQHLSVLRGRQLVVSRKEGNQVFYSIRDPLLFEMLDTMRLYCLSHLADTRSLLEELESETAATSP